MGKKLAGYVTATHPETGDSRTYGPGEDLPDWLDADAPHLKELLEKDDMDEDELVSGPGVVGAPEETEEDRKKREAARKKAYRDRKAKEKADADAVQAAQEAEAKRAAEEEATRKAAEQGGGS